MAPKLTVGLLTGEEQPEEQALSEQTENSVVKGVHAELPAEDEKENGVAFVLGGKVAIDGLVGLVNATFNKPLLIVQAE